MKLDTALTYLEYGFSLVPMHYRSDYPADSLLRLDRHSNAKRWEDFRERKPNPREVCFWFKQTSSVNVGVILGPVSRGLAVLEFLHNAGEIFPVWQSAIGPIADCIPLAKTAKGLQAFFYYKGCSLSGSLARSKDHQVTINLKGRGKHNLLPGSWLPSGEIYDWSHLDYMRIPTLTDRQYQKLMRVARELDHGGNALFSMHTGRYWRLKLDSDVSSN